MSQQLKLPKRISTAAHQGYWDVVAEELIRHNKLNFRMRDGRTLLMVAACENRVDVVDRLLAHQDQLDLNARDRVGNTALMLAAFEENEEVVDKLLAAGASVFALNNQHFHAIMHTYQPRIQAKLRIAAAQQRLGQSPDTVTAVSRVLESGAVAARARAPQSKNEGKADEQAPLLPASSQ